jgi:hypothetical protein
MVVNDAAVTVKARTVLIGRLQGVGMCPPRPLSEQKVKRLDLLKAQ